MAKNIQRLWYRIWIWTIFGQITSQIQLLDNLRKRKLSGKKHIVVSLVDIVNFFPVLSRTVLSLYSLSLTSRTLQSLSTNLSFIVLAMSQDPFKDPNGSQRSSSIANRLSHTESTAQQEKIVIDSPQQSVPLSNQLTTGGMGGIPPPKALLPTHTQGSNHEHRQEPSRYTSQNQIEAIDHITPIPRIGQIDSQRSSYGGGSSGDESTSSGLSERRPIPEPLDRRPEKIKSGHRWIVTTKWIFIATLIAMK